MKRQGVLRYIDEHVDEMIGFLQSMIRAKSVNRSQASGFWLGTEANVAEVILPELKSIGFEVDIFEVEAGRPNVVARLRGKRGTPRLLINSHMDTVPVEPRDLPKWRFNPFSAEVADGYIWGRGSCDHKSSGAAMIWAAKALNANGVELEGDLIVVQDSDEEFGGESGFKYLAEKLRDKIEADMAIYAVTTQVTRENRKNFPTVGDSNIIVRTSAYMPCKITIWEKDVHPENIPSSNNSGQLGELCLNFIPTLAVLMEKTASRSDPMVGNDKMILNSIQFHHRKHWETVPGKCEIVVGSMLSPEHDTTVVLKEIKMAAEEFGRANGVRVDVEEMVGRSGPLSIWPRRGILAPEDSAIVKALKKAATEVTGIEPKVTGAPLGGPSLGFQIFVNGLGIPVALFGYGCFDFHHTINERISVEDFRNTAKVYALTFMDVLKATSL